VIGRELEIPLQRAGVGVQRDDAVGIEIVALTLRRIPVGAGIAGTEIDGVERRIEGAHRPDRGAARLPGIAVPGLRPLFARLRNGVEAPELLAGPGVVRSDE